MQLRNMYHFFDVPLWAVFALFLPQFETQRTTFVPLYAKRGLHLFQAATLIFQTISEFSQPKYRLSNPSNALPWRASSRAICPKNPDIVEKIHSSFHHLSNKSRTSFKKLRTILVHLRRLKWVLQTQQAYIKDLTVSGNTDSLSPSMGKNFHAENPPI